MFMCSLRTGATCEYIVECLVTAHRCVHTGRANSVDIDVVACQFDGQCFDEANHTVFGSDIMCQIFHTLKAGRRCNTDDFATAPGKHIWDAYFARDPHTLEIDVDGLIPLCFAHLPASRKGVEASICYHDVYR